MPPLTPLTIFYGALVLWGVMLLAAGLWDLGQLIRWRVLKRLAWPAFDCTDCIGMRYHGCYCEAHACVAPCVPPEPWRVWLRKALAWRLK